MLKLTPPVTKILKICLLGIAVLSLILLIVHELFESHSCDCRGNVAIIRIDGNLVEYKNSDGVSTEKETSSEEVVSLIDRVGRDKDIKAVILEVASTGGDISTGEEIANALKHLNKPSVALIRGEGDSSAYWASTGANRIFVQDISDVGDIGITSSYLDSVNSDISNGLTFHELTSAKFKDMGDPHKVLTTEEKTMIDSQLKIEHQAFVDAVARNRNMDIAKVAELANGSSYIGQEAVDNGLADQIGDIYDVENYLGNLLHTNVKVCELSQ